MKLEVKSLVPNPYRKMERYPIDSDKVEALKVSIKDTTFWDNILVRQKGKIFEIAYGHHRLIALQELGLGMVDIPVRDLDDATMLKIMANENLNDWRTSPRVINETVLVAKEFLDAEFSKYASWEEFQSRPDLLDLLEQKTAKAFNKVKAGVGQTTILKFLGGNWKQWQIAEALMTLKDDKDNKVDREALEQFDKQATAKAFRESIKGHKVPKKEQRALAKTIADKGIGERERIDQVVQEHQEIRHPKTRAVEPKKVPGLDERISEMVKAMYDLRIKLGKVRGYLEYIESGPLRVNFNLEGNALRAMLCEIFPEKEK